MASDFDGESEIVSKIELFCIAGDTSSEIFALPKLVYKIKVKL